MNEYYRIESKEDGLAAYITDSKVGTNKYSAVMRDTDAQETLASYHSNNYNQLVKYCDSFVKGIKL